MYPVLVLLGIHFVLLFLCLFLFLFMLFYFCWMIIVSGLHCSVNHFILFCFILYNF